MPKDERKGPSSLTNDEWDIIACVLDSALDKGWFDPNENNPWFTKAEALAEKLERHGFVRKALV